MSELNEKIHDTATGSAEKENYVETLTESQKDGIITQIIDDLATDSEYSTNNRCIFHIKALESVYKDGNYKEKYSNIFSSLCNYLSDKENSLEVLQINLETLFQKISTSVVCENTLKSFKDLFDIINLEISRYGFYNSAKVDKGDNSLCTEEVKGKLKKLESDIEISNSVTTEAKKAIIHVDDKIEKNSLSSITALSVFSAVVLTFSGGMTVVSGVLGEMSSTSPLRVAFVGSLLGFILFNTIFMLLYVVGIMTGKRITQDNKISICETSNGRPNGFCRIIHRYLYVFVVNAIFIILMYYSAVIYLFKTNALYPLCPLCLKIAAGILPFVVFVIAAFLSYQPFGDKIQQKRLYNSYKERILSILATNSRITGKPREYNRRFYQWNDFERSCDNDLAESLALSIYTLKNKQAIKKIIEKKVREGFIRNLLFSEDSIFISFAENRKIKRKTKCIINYILSKLVN